MIAAESFQLVRDEATFEQRWRNWISWCIRKGLHQGRTGSAEGAWRSPQIWHPPEPRPPALDEIDAIAVNRAFTQLAMIAPRQANIIKVLVFRPHWKPQWQAQKLGIHYAMLDEALDRAKTMLRNRLKA